MIAAGVDGADAALITELVEQYGIAFDTRDRELILACFTDDVHLNYLNGQKVVRGLADVRDQMFRFDPGEAQPLAGIGRIVHSDHRFRLDWLRAAGPATETEDVTGIGDVAGQVSGIAHLLTERDGQASLAIRGIRYTDRYTRTDAGWRIAERRHEQLWQANAPARLFDQHI